MEVGMGMGPPVWWWGVGLDESLYSALFWDNAG